MRGITQCAAPAEADRVCSRVLDSVSTLTSALNPACSNTAASASVMCKRTGTRCTTLTQLPVAFSGGSSENWDPVPGLKLTTCAVKRLPGKRSILTVALCPGCICANCTSLKLASIQVSRVATSANTG